MSPAGGYGPASATTCEASWFCCGAAWGPCSAAGGGACGNCNSSSMQCAWPYTSASCLSITQPGDCGTSLVEWGCGHTFYIQGLCNSANITVKIADCGPHTNDWCGEQHCCGGKCGTNRLIDLTPAAYSKVASLSTGLTAISVHS
jgi:hypothetical protein